MGCHFLLQGIFPTQGLNPGLPHCRHLSHQGSPFLSCHAGSIIISIPVTPPYISILYSKNEGGEQL